MSRLLRKRVRRIVRERLEWPLVARVVGLAAKLIRLLPYAAVWWLARFCGGLAWMVPSIRRLTVTNIQIALPEADAKRIGRESLTHLCATFLETFWVYQRPDRLADRVDLAELDAVSRQLLDEDGCLFISPHLGNWELGNQGLARAGVPVSCVAQEQRNPGIEKLFMPARTSYGGEVIHERGAIRGILKAIKNRRLVGILIDQNTPTDKGGTFVPFFGLPALTSPAPALLARRTGVRLVVGFLQRLPGGRFVARFGLVPGAAADYDSDGAMMLAISRQSEAFVREAPEQYLWFYRKWRDVPKNVTAAERARFPYYAKETGFEWER